MTDLVYVALVLLLIAGVLVVAWGMLGRIVNGNPYCRACGFELSGLPRDQACCPECAGALSGARAVRFGVRRRNGWQIALGLAIVLGAIVLLCTAVYLNSAS